MSFFLNIIKMGCANCKIKKKNYDVAIKLLRKTLENADKRIDTRLDNNYEHLLVIEQQLQQIKEDTIEILRVLSY